MISLVRIDQLYSIKTSHYVSLTTQGRLLLIFQSEGQKPRSQICVWMIIIVKIINFFQTSHYYHPSLKKDPNWFWGQRSRSQSGLFATLFCIKTPVLNQSTLFKLNSFFTAFVEKCLCLIPVNFGPNCQWLWFTVKVCLQNCFLKQLSSERLNCFQTSL